MSSTDTSLLDGSRAKPAPFTHEFRVRYAEADMQAVVFNSRYLEYADLLITEYFRESGLHFTGEGSLEFHVARAVVDFRKPILADEIVVGTVRTDRIGNSSMTTLIELHGKTDGTGAGAGSGDDLRAAIELVHVHVDLESGSAIRIPDAARALLLGTKNHG